MAWILVALSLMIIALCVFGMAQPHRLVALVRSVDSTAGLSAAVVVRLLLAATLWLTAPVSHTPTVFKALAAIALIAAVALPLIGRARMGRLIDYFATWPQWLIRAQCVVGAAFGVFLIWSVSPALGV